MDHQTEPGPQLATVSVLADKRAAKFQRALELELAPDAYVDDLPGVLPWRHAELRPPRHLVLVKG